MMNTQLINRSKSSPLHLANFSFHASKISGFTSFHPIFALHTCCFNMILFSSSSLVGCIWLIAFSLSLVSITIVGSGSLIFSSYLGLHLAVFFVGSVLGMQWSGSGKLAFETNSLFYHQPYAVYHYMLLHALFLYHTVCTCFLMLWLNCIFPFLMCTQMYPVTVSVV